MSLHNVSYQHWEGKHHGIWYRRGVIAGNGLRGCLDNKWARHLVLVAWVLCLLEVAILFLVGQLLVKDSIIYTLVNQLGDQQRILLGTLVDWLTDNPEVSVRTTYNILFYFFATYLRLFAMIAVALVIPHLITQDLASRAIIIYSSKAVSRFDYLLGKFGTVFGLLALIWLGPVTVAWFAGNLMASDWTFFWHSRSALINIFTYVVPAMVILSLVSMGISSLSSKPRAATSYWIIFWLVGNAIRAIGEATKPWLRHFSISYDLDQLSAKVFNLKEEMEMAMENIRFLEMFLGGMRNTPFNGLNWFQTPDVTGTLIALAIMVAGSLAIMKARVKPE